MLETVHFDSEVDGKHFLVLGAIHGNEICGPVALNKVVQQVQSGQLKLLQGKVTFVPICNPEAYEQGIRFVDRDLNRFMSPIETPKVYEDFLTNELCSLLEQADVLLDIHSYKSGGVPFAFVETPQGKEVPFAQSIGVDHMVYGFSNAYQNAAAPTQEEREAARKESMGTTEYMRQFGGYGFTLECGKNGSSESIEFAESAVLNGLAYLGMIDPFPVHTSKPKIVEIESVHYRQEGENLASQSFNFASFCHGDVITTMLNKPKVVSDSDAMIVLPDRNASVGEAWFYLGRTVN